MVEGNDILRIGHRGAPSRFLENTLHSIQHAIELGVDMVEFDIRKTMDDHFVLLHNSRLGRFLFSSSIARKPLEELQSLRMRRGEPLALLQDAIDMVKNRALMNIDLKAEGGEEMLVDMIVRKGVAEQVLVSSNFKESLRKIKNMEPRIRTGLSLPKDFFHASSFEHVLPLRAPIIWIVKNTLRFWIIRQVEKAEADAVMLYYRLITPKLVEFMRQRGYPVFAYTVDDVSAIRRLTDMGVRGIASNRPELLFQN
ncbi:MAG: glycerophosphodiester phosphodiesterase [Candidatus Eisenbacteria bacterium]|nr:glycerophosphodiester phosphodiesterase [Candidatus Eisenbacteria bacterium]